MSRNARQTRERLFDCALSLFAERGYAATSVREIIEAAGVTRPVLYYYCESKEDLFRQLVRSYHEQAYRELTAALAAADDCPSRLRELARGSFAFCARDPRIPRLMFQTFYGSPIEGIAEFLESLTALRFGIVTNVMQEGLNTGQLQGGDAASLALVFCSLIDHHCNTLSKLSDPASRLTPALADALVEVFLYGVGTDQRRTVRLPAFAAGT
jgi:TetR/AcrR family transcriptional regulator